MGPKKRADCLHRLAHLFMARVACWHSLLCLSQWGTNEICTHTQTAKTANTQLTKISKKNYLKQPTSLPAYQLFACDLERPRIRDSPTAPSMVTHNTGGGGASSLSPKNQWIPMCQSQQSMAMGNWQMICLQWWGQRQLPRRTVIFPGMYQSRIRYFLGS